MGFNPLAEKGIPLDKQIRNWQELNVEPYRAHQVHPYTRTRVITMNGVEIESIRNSHSFARHTDNLEIKGNLAYLRRLDQQQQKVVNWLIPGGESPLEVTIGYEQVAVDLTAYLARTESDPYIKQTLEFGLLEDFDHLYRYANLYDLLTGKKAERLTANLTEIMPGRPTIFEHRHPFDEVRAHYSTHTVDPLSRLHVLTILAAEQQTMDYYMNVGPSQVEPIARNLYQEIAMIEEQHVSQYESLLDPLESWLQREVFHHYNEAYLYWSFCHEEVDERIKRIWDLHLHMELEHIRVAGEMLQKFEGIAPAEILPKELPEPTRFRENKAYIRKLLATQLNLRTVGPQYVPMEQLAPDSRSFQFQNHVNGSGPVPSEQVIDEARRKSGRDYRMETEGVHPVDTLRQAA